MKTRILSLLSIFVFIFFEILGSFAASAASEATYKHLLQREEALEAELQELRQELRALKQPVAPPKLRKKNVKKYNNPSVESNLESIVQRQHFIYKTSVPRIPNNHTLSAHAHDLPDVLLLPEAARPFHLLGGIPVTTSPYLGVPAEFDASHLVINIPSINEDLRLLRQKAKMEKTLISEGLGLPKNPMVDLSGKVEILGSTQDPYEGDQTADIDLESAELHFFILMNKWTNALISLAYDNNLPIIGQQRTTNSRVFVDKSFITLGNQRLIPAYFTAGQYYVPFGRYSSNMISSPLTQIIGRSKARAVLLGYHPIEDHGLFGAIYGFRSDSGPSHGQGGVNIAYNFAHEDLISGEIGAGYISTMADANGIQSNGSGVNFMGLNATAATENIFNRVPAADLYANFDIGRFSWVNEYISAVRGFSDYAVTFNGNGAQPRAFNTELAYHFKIYSKPTSIAIGYAQTSQSFAFALPRRRYSAVINSNLLEDTLFSLEFRRDVNYPSGTTASGLAPFIIDDLTSSAILVPVSTSGLGKTSNTVLAQIGVYF